MTELCNALMSNTNLHRYAGIHTGCGPYPLLSLGLKHKAYMQNILGMIKVPFIFETNFVICKLYSRGTNNICIHFLVDWPCLYMHRDELLDSIVNCLEVSQYVSFSNLSAQEQCDFILWNMGKWMNFVGNI